jgi:hypothetical protein
MELGMLILGAIDPSHMGLLGIRGKTYIDMGMDQYLLIPFLGG